MASLFSRGTEEMGAARPPVRPFSGWLLPVAVLSAAYGLLALTFCSTLSHAEVMQRCVLVDPKMARIWSVGNVEIGLGYLGVFSAMLFYFLGIYRRSAIHLRDLAYAMLYLLASFALNYVCVRAFAPFVAMLVGDAIVMTFTLIVSRQLWFQRLLGVFVPIIFLTCGVGHFLEGVSYWYLTYPINVPWTMVTADVGFAVLVNASRFPAFIRGEDIVAQLSQERERTVELEAEAAARQRAESENIRLLQHLQETVVQQRRFLRDVLMSVTEGRLRFCADSGELPEHRGKRVFQTELLPWTLRQLRQSVRETTERLAFDTSAQHDLQTAVGEAAMNAVVHAGGGLGSVYADEGEHCTVIQVWIEDGGSGIPLEALPLATLQQGYSSRGTLGQGFWLILRTADRVWLKTSQGGTTIVIEQEYRSPSADIFVEKHAA
jgi:anti-sigma regulatory factor (Ser/Thr protein kinase)